MASLPDSLRRVPRLIARHRSRLTQALRMTAASLATFVLAESLDLPQAYWAVITALIVTQSSVGGSLKAALDRFLGSVLGACYGGAVAFAIPHHGGAATLAALFVAVAPLTLAAAVSAGFRIAPITAIIVLLSTTGSTLGPLAFALDRIFEIGLGCVVGLAVSLLVAPARAARAVTAQGASLARLLADQLDALARLDAVETPEAKALPPAVRRGLSRLETLAGEAARERRSRLSAAPDPDPLLRTLMRLRHDLVLLRRAIAEADEDVLRVHLAEAWGTAARAAASRLRATADALESGRRPAGDDAALAAAIAGYRDAIDGMRQRQVTRTLSTDGVGRIFWLAFSLEQLRRNLDDLAERAADFAAPEAGTGA
ncbi:FUSC family protein [Methylobacterium nonmethylotrophicum]|uniref:FUSC family protein n=1 Tax=Methylobacterium nonmethylotrophicum TaxID=1141884 RepID=A0A4Z0NKZ5_9HYPH|nr:FUSC family protein [Methylobacterium nonmethylotrophicum]TGD96595.1 FUSC family protein [Methylobacterium nonmethylotrophicum]